MATDFEKMLDVLKDPSNSLGEIVVNSRHDEILGETFDEILIHDNEIIFSFHQDTSKLSHVYP